MKPMKTLQDLLDEAKVRTVWWGLCIFGISYFLSHTSKSMWMNIPISILILFAFRYLSYEVELRWKIRPVQGPTFLSILQKEQLSLNDPRISIPTQIQRWTKKIDSPLVENAIHDFTNKIMQDFVVDLWYATITPDKEGPELIRGLILDAIGEISGRIKELNLVKLLTSDMVDLVGEHLNLFRKYQSTIGIEVMGTLSSEERDERLKYYLMSSKELHPALVSPESEYKILQRLVGGVLAVVLDPRETPVVRCISRELLTCLVLEPVMNFACPAYINELIELAFTDPKDNKSREGSTIMTTGVESFSNAGSILGNPPCREHVPKNNSVSSVSGDIVLSSTVRETTSIFQANVLHEDPTQTIHQKPADWARILDAATQRRTQVLAPENLENMWTKGRNYQKKAAKLAKTTVAVDSSRVTSGILDSFVQPVEEKKTVANSMTTSLETQSGKALVGANVSSNDYLSNTVTNAGYSSHDLEKNQHVKGGSGWIGDSGRPLEGSKIQLKRSSSTSDLRKDRDSKISLTNKLGEIGSESYNPDAQSTCGSIIVSEGSSKKPKIKCRVVGAYFEKAGSNPFAVYSILVTDAENKSWFVKRRYRNFERLHRHLKDIPNYTLHLPPKRFLSSSIDDYFVHKRCILLDKYLQDLLSIANIAEQHEVWDFLSTTSKNYSFGNGVSVMKTLAVNVDDAVDDIVRQFKGVSGGLRRVVASPPSSCVSSHIPIPVVASASAPSWNEEEIKLLNYDNADVSRSLSDEEVPEQSCSASIGGWFSDNESDSKVLSNHLYKHEDGSGSLESQKSNPSEKVDQVFIDQDHFLSTSAGIDNSMVADPVVVPPEWSPPNVSVPLLNLVDNIFQLNQRGWIRRQVFWISKQILQLMMEDAIDDWIVRQINLLRRDDIVAYGIQWVQDILWPGGSFFIKLSASKETSEVLQKDQHSAPVTQSMARGKRPLSFEEQLEAARRASDVKKMILNGAPTTLVSLIGAKQYKRCARDIYYFLQSSICIKQLAYGMLEVVLISIFPELQDLVSDIHQKKETPPA